MKMFHLVLGVGFLGLLLTGVIYFFIGFGLVKGAQYIDNNGGLKAVSERVWEGNSSSDSTGN